MFDGTHLGPQTLEAGTHARIADLIGPGRKINHRIEINATENNAGVWRSRSQGHIDLDAGVQADAGSADQRFESALFEHVS